MRIINVIEIVENKVQGITSFPIEEDQLSQEVVKKAEDLFVKIALENGAIEDDMDSHIEDGYYEGGGTYCVNITWS